MPVFSNVMQSFMDARRGVATHRLMGPAMSGDLSALNELMAVNPQAGMQVQQVMGQRQQQEAQARQQAEQNEYQRKQDAIRMQLEAMRAGAQFDPESGKITQNAPGAFQFEGGLTADMMNLISQAESNPAIKQTPQYKLAMAQIGKPQYIQTEQGMMRIPGIDVASVLGGASKSVEPSGDGVLPGSEKTSPLQSEYNKKYQGLESFNRQFNAYRDLLERLGPQVSAGPLNARDSTELATAYTALTAEAKNAFELGALAKDDLALIERFAANPTELSGAAKGKEALLGGLDRAADYFSNKQKSFESAYEGENVKRKQLTKLKRGTKKQAIPTKNQAGWILHTDSNGNKAYVGPNGEIEEVE